jgi:hypothetical protein
MKLATQQPQHSVFPCRRLLDVSQLVSTSTAHDAWTQKLQHRRRQSKPLPHAWTTCSCQLVWLYPSSHIFAPAIDSDLLDTQ